MRFIKFFSIIFVLFLMACTSTPEATRPPSPQRSPGLPPTWTPTASLPPTQTPVRTATLTFTPFPSVTPLPATLTGAPTSDLPAPMATATVTATISGRCTVSALEEGVILQPAPYSDPYGLLPTMAPTATYQAASISLPYYELQLENQTAGWIDSSLTSIKIEGDCDNLPVDARKPEDFPGLCLFTPDNQEVQTYRDSTLNEPLDTISGPGSFLTLLQLEGIYCTIASPTGTGFCVEAAAVRVFGACENTTHSGITTAEGWLWSQPDGELGHETVSFGREMVIYLQNHAVQGPKPPASSEEGAWYYVRIGSQKDGSYGWIWSAYFNFR